MKTRFADGREIDHGPTSFSAEEKAARAARATEIERTRYRENRKQAFQQELPVGDQLDIIQRALRHLAVVVDMSGMPKKDADDLAVYFAKIDEIKARHMPPAPGA